MEDSNNHLISEVEHANQITVESEALRKVLEQEVKDLIRENEKWKKDFAKEVETNKNSIASMLKKNYEKI